MFTATEAGAIAVLYCFVVGRFVRRELTWAACATAQVRSVVGTATVLIILGSAILFAWIVVELRVSDA